MIEAARSEAADGGAAAALAGAALGSGARAADVPGTFEAGDGPSTLKSRSPFGTTGGATAGVPFVTALLSVFLEKPMDFPNIEKATENDPFFLMDAASADARLLVSLCAMLRNAQREFPLVDLYVLR